MQKILVLTDLHVTEEGETIIGLDPVARLRAVLRQALNDHGDAERIVVTGDLTHGGRPAEYRRLREMIDRLPLPVDLTLGNHDDRRAFRDAFPEHVDEAGFAQKVVDLPGWRLVILDTLDDAPPVRHAGVLCPARLAFLEAALQGAGTAQTLVLMHHPPFRTGFRGMDAIRLRNDAETRAILTGHGIALCVAGHVHRTIGGVVQGLPVAVFKSPCHQMPLDLEDEGTAAAVDEPGAYGLLLLTGEGVVVLSEDNLPGRRRMRDGASA